MRLFALLVVFSIGLMSPVPGFGETDIILAVPKFEPYTNIENEEIQGRGGTLVKIVLDNMEIRYSLKQVPNYGRAFKETENGRADGFFLATQNKERDNIAVFSEPVLFNRWSWFFTADRYMDPWTPNFKTTALVGTALHTNTQLWLEKNGYQRINPILKFKKLPLLLTNKRLDAVFLSESVFLNSVSEAKLSSSRFKMKLQEEKPFGIYISKKFLKKNPGFMKQLNEAIRGAKQ
ncbi:MAG: transporter substrate-binding domain-containing protein [Deltaproteobacteria bacterium]|nr:transporter substrate-binding domain-containing protein [Deltaproteobacteria bacterium]